MIGLDTNAVIALLKARPVSVRIRMEQTKQSGGEFFISIITHYELVVGAEKSARREANLRAIRDLLATSGIAVLPFEQRDSSEAADIRAHLERLGTPIGPYDTLIAGQARARGATLVTANTREFDRVPGLLVVDWAR